MKFIFKLILCSFLLFPMLLSAQVIDGKFNTMLKELLDHSVKEISVKEFTESKLKYLLLDARSKKEFEVSKIKNAIWVGYSPSDLSMLVKLPKNTPIIVYCSVGYRSEKIAEKIIAKGFTDVQNLYGGIFEWVNESKPILDKNNTVTDKIHPYDSDWGKWLNKGNKSYQ